MKLDKETLVKQQFWIGFGVLLLLILATLLYLQGGVAEGNATKAQELAKHKADLEKEISKPARNKQEIREMKNRVVGLEKRREEIWEKAWKMQEEVMSWPPAMQADLGKMHFGEKIKDDAIRGRFATKAVYDEEVKQLQDTFRVTATIDKDEKTFDLVQFKDKKVLTTVDDWTKLGKAPTSEEVWLAQEDIWVQREILNAIRDAVYTVARFEKAKESPAAGKGELFRESYANAEWQLDLALLQVKEGYQLKGKIKNITDHAMPLGKLFFLVQLHQGDAKPVVLPVEGPMLPSGKDWAIADVPLNLAARPDGILSVMELYDSRTSPIRRVEEIALGAQAHRTYTPQLRPAKFGEEEALKGPSGPAPGSVGSGAAAKGRDFGGVDRTPNGLVRDRYLDATDQVRRMPLGIVILMDQGHVPEVLAALTNSKLRLQVTQVGWQHFRGNLAPSAVVGSGTQPKAGAGDGEQRGNLIELTVYCVASLYEKYPPANRVAPATPPPPPAKPPAK